RFYTLRPPAPPALHAFPTRRSSDLAVLRACADERREPAAEHVHADRDRYRDRVSAGARGDDRSLAVRRGRAHPRRTARERSSPRSEEHTSELQSLAYLVCRLLLEKK